MYYDTKIMIDAHKTTIAVKSGQINIDVINECRAHCEYMTKHGMSHNGANKRIQRLRKIYKDYSFSEIVAENNEKNPEKAASKFYQQWKHSRGHWKILSAECDIYGFSLCVYKGRYYGIGLFGKRH